MYSHVWGCHNLRMERILRAGNPLDIDTVRAFSAAEAHENSTSFHIHIGDFCVCACPLFRAPKPGLQSLTGPRPGQKLASELCMQMHNHFWCNIA
jgi:hypothetical protein